MKKRHFCLKDAFQSTYVYGEVTFSSLRIIKMKLFKIAGNWSLLANFRRYIRNHAVAARQQFLDNQIYLVT